VERRLHLFCILVINYAISGAWCIYEHENIFVVITVNYYSDQYAVVSQANQRHIDLTRFFLLFQFQLSN